MECRSQPVLRSAVARCTPAARAGSRDGGHEEGELGTNRGSAPRRLRGAPTGESAAACSPVWAVEATAETQRAIGSPDLGGGVILRRLVLAAAILASTTAAMAPVAHAQGGPGIGFGPPTPGYGGVPMVPSSAPARPQAESSAPTTPDACRLGVARAAYPMVTQMVRYANAFQAYPMGPNGRPLLAPTPLLYPGFAGSI